MWARVIATRSTNPSRTQCSAVARSAMRVAWKTARPVSRFIAAAMCTKGARGPAMLGIAFESPRSSPTCPAITFMKSHMPVSA